MSFPLYHVIEKQTLVSFNISSPSTWFFHCILTVNLNLCTCIYVDSKDALIKICDYAYVSASCYHHLRKKNQFHKNVYCSWIYNYLCNQCLSPLTLWVRIPLRRGVLDTTLCDKVCQWLAAGQWFSLGTRVSSTIKTDCHDITEILLKMALNAITLFP